MQVFRRKSLTGLDRSGHFHSEPHLRIQVLVLQPAPDPLPDLFGNYHGEVLAICLEGSAIVHTAEKDPVVLEAGDQMVLMGEAFRAFANDAAIETRVEFVWSPGLSGCDVCKENARR